MVLKRFCDVCGGEAEGGYGFMNTSSEVTETIDMCKKCEKKALKAIGWNPKPSP